MARNSDRLAGAFETEKDGFLSGFLAEEEELDRRSLWRIGAWGVGAVAAVVAAVWANQASLSLRHDLAAAADLARQAQLMQAVAKDSQNEARRLSAAVEILNSDRDRLFARVTVLEQGLDSVTGAIARQNANPPPSQTTAKATAPAEPPPQPAQPQAAAPALSPVATAPAAPPEKPRETASAEPGQPSAPAATPSVAAPQTPPPQPATAASLVASKSMLAPPDPAASKLFEASKAAAAKTDQKTDATPAPQALAAVAPKEMVKATAKEAPQETAKETAPKEAAAKDVATKDAPPKDAAPKDSAAKEGAGAEQEALEAALPKVPVPRTEFAVDLGSAHSIGGLRALWRGLSRSNAELAVLRPIIVVREGNTGLAMQLRLAAGPLTDAAAAAKICAALIANDRSCETTVFDGQQLAMKEDEAGPAGAVKPAPAAPHRRGYYSRRKKEEPSPAPQPPKAESSGLSRLFQRQ